MLASRTSITDTLKHATEIGATDGPELPGRSFLPSPFRWRHPPQRSPRKGASQEGLGWSVEDLATVLPGLTSR